MATPRGRGARERPKSSSSSSNAKAKTTRRQRPKLLPHERKLVASGELAVVTHKNASSAWLHADSKQPGEGQSLVYRPMGDAELLSLLENGVLPATQPYQAIIEGRAGREYAEKYLKGHKKVDSNPTTVVEFAAPKSLISKLFSIFQKPEDGAMSCGLGNKAGNCLGLFNKSLETGDTTFRIVTVKRGKAQRAVAGARNRSRNQNVTEVKSTSTVEIRPNSEILHMVYPKMHTSTQKWESGSKKQARLRRKAKWVVTEKIHGANLCYACDGKHVQPAKRSAPLRAHEDFFGLRSSGLDAILGPKVLNLHKNVAKQRAKSSFTLYLYGELHGGSYPGVEDSMDDPVQPGISYHPKLQYCGFDLALSIKSKEGLATPELTFLPYDIARQLCTDSGIMFANPLCVGSLEKCLSYPTEIPTTIPKIHGLPEAKENYAEGIVIRPLSLPDRLMVKRKASAFSEKKYHAGSKKGQVAKSKDKVWGAQGRAVQELLFEATARLQLPRVAAVVSKHGRIDPSNAAEVSLVVDMLIVDASEDMRFDGVVISDELVPLVRPQMEARSVELVKEFYSRSRSSKGGRRV